MAWRSLERCATQSAKPVTVPRSTSATSIVPHGRTTGVYRAARAHTAEVVGGCLALAAPAARVATGVVALVALAALAAAPGSVAQMTAGVLCVTESAVQDTATLGAAFALRTAGVGCGTMVLSVPKRFMSEDGAKQWSAQTTSLTSKWGSATRTALTRIQRELGQFVGWTSNAFMLHLPYIM